MLLDMEPGKISGSGTVRPLGAAVGTGYEKILNPESQTFYSGIRAGAPVLVILAAGKGTRFGRDPKCIQPVHGTPLDHFGIDRANGKYDNTRPGKDQANIQRGTIALPGGAAFDPATDTVRVSSSSVHTIEAATATAAKRHTGARSTPADT